MPPTLFSNSPKPRHGGFRIEIPIIQERYNFQEAASILLPKALEECHPIVRLSETRVRFVGELAQVQSNGHQITAGAEKLSLKYYGIRQSFIRVNLNQFFEDFKPDTESVIEAGILYLILHELYEDDYNFKSGNLVHKLPKSKNGDLDYEDAEHEVIANQKAFKMLLNHYPNATLL